jgi:hypothetical protein
MGKILYLNTYNIYTENHGGALCCRAEIQCLQNLGFEVDFRFPSKVGLFYSLYHLLAGKFKYPLSVCYFGCLHKQWKNLDFNNYELIIFSHDQSTFGLTSKNINKSKLILRKHNIEHRNLRGIKRVDYYFLKKYEVKLVSIFNKILYVSSDLSWTNKKNILYLPPLLPPNNIKHNNLNKFQYQFGVVLSYDWWPNRHAVEFMGKLHFSNDVHFFGRATEKIKGFPHFKGHGSFKDICEIYDLIEFIIVFSFSGSGVKMKLIEAIAHGKNVVINKRSLEGLEILQDINSVYVIEDESHIDYFQIKEHFRKKSKTSVSYLDLYSNYQKEFKNAYSTDL